MAAIMRYGNKILRRNGKIARGRKCCCSNCGCDPEPPGNLKAIFRALTPDCATYDGTEFQLVKQHQGYWELPLPHAFQNVQGWDRMAMQLECSRPNDVNPSGEFPGIMDYVWRGGYANAEILPHRSFTGTCSPFRLVSDEIVVPGLSGDVCEVCTCDLAADNRFYWEIVEA